MTIQAGRSFGAQSMAAPLKRVLMRPAESAMRRADRSEWHYGPGFDPARYTGRSQAVGGIVTGIIGVSIFTLVTVLIVLAVVAGIASTDF